MNLKSDIRIKILNDIGPRPIEKYVFKKKKTTKQNKTKQNKQNKTKQKTKTKRNTKK